MQSADYPSFRSLKYIAMHSGYANPKLLVCQGQEKLSFLRSAIQGIAQLK